MLMNAPRIHQTDRSDIVKSQLSNTARCRQAREKSAWAKRQFLTSMSDHSEARRLAASKFTPSTTSNGRKSKRSHWAEISPPPFVTFSNIGSTRSTVVVFRKARALERAADTASRKTG